MSTLVDLLQQRLEVAMESMRAHLVASVYLSPQRHAMNSAETTESNGTRRGRMLVVCEPKVTP